MQKSSGLYTDMFKALKKEGVTRDEVLNVLDFDSDEYPDNHDLEATRDEVYGPKINTIKREQPELDICSSCGEHCEFEHYDVGFRSNCCGTGPINTDPDLDMER